MTQSKAHTQMACLRGSAALSQFRIEKIQSQLNQKAVNITHIYAEFRHFVWTDAAMSDGQQNTLEQILTYGPTMQAEDP